MRRSVPWLWRLVGLKVGAGLVALAVLYGGVRLGEVGVVAAEGGSDAEVKKIATGGFELPGLDPELAASFERLLRLQPVDPERMTRAELERYLGIIEQSFRQAKDQIMLLQQRQEELGHLQQKIDESLGKLDEQRLFIAQTLQREKEIKQERLDELTGMIEKMEPKKAGPIVAEMDRDLALALLRSLKPKLTTKILENMEPKAARQTLEYLGRVNSGGEFETLREINASLRDAFTECGEKESPRGSD